MTQAAMVALLASALLLSFCGSPTHTGNESPPAQNKQETSGMITDTAVLNKYKKQGMELAQKTGALLLKNLTEAYEQQGAAYAIQFCNTHALQLTDSLADGENTSIRRISNKARNPQNQALGEELAILLTMQQAMQAKQKPMPVLSRPGDGRVIGYYPIITNDFCVNCHGDKTAMDAGALKKLRELYPADSATGYSTNQLRGLWVVSMKTP